MSAVEILPEDVADYRTFVRTHLGLTFEPAELAPLTAALEGRLRHLGLQSAHEFCQRLNDVDVAATEIEAAAKALTIGETYFFRYPEQFNALAEVGLPSCWAQRKHLRLLSAGCSSGEEAYTIALLALDHPMAAQGCTADILGVDINEDVLTKARAAGYTPWSFRQDALLMQSPHMVADGKHYRLSDAVRRRVQFAQANLADDQDPLWNAAPFDIIFCRNVLIYFDDVGRNAVQVRLRNLLRTGGYLFLGHAETMRLNDKELQLMHTHAAFYYQRGAGAASRAGSAASSDSSDWLQRIAASSQRLAASIEPPVASHVRVDAAANPRAAAIDATLLEAQQLFDQERFTEALDLLIEMPKSPTNLQAQLLLAALLTNSARFIEASEACDAIILQDSLHAGAYCLQALCKENSGDPAGALHAATVAASLDDRFAMAHFHMGRLLQKAGRHSQARDALRRAHELLHHEDAARLALFGGGFSRTALLDICQRELSAYGKPR